MTRVEPQVRDWGKYKVRLCRSLHFCELCKDDIVLGEYYYDGGYGKRVHVKCRTLIKKAQGGQ